MDRHGYSRGCRGEVKEMATHSSILVWRTPGTEEPGGPASMGLHRVGHESRRGYVIRLPFSSLNGQK